MISRVTLLATILVTSTFAGYSTNASAEISNITQAINDGGRQRMLTQRMLKNYALIGLGIDVEESRAQAEAAAELFEKQLKDLIAYKVNSEVAGLLLDIQDQWPKFRATVLSDSPSVDNTTDLRKLTDDLLASCHDVVLALEDASGGDTGRLVNISGRQRMLSQRMASLYALLAWGNTSSRNKSDFRQAMNEFKGALGELLDASENTEEITRGLKRVKAQFSIFEYSARIDSGEYIPKLISNASEKILVMMNETTAQYANL